MKRSLGVIFMLLGVAMLCGALFLYLHNAKEDQQAQESVEYYLPQIKQVIEENIAKRKEMQAVTIQDNDDNDDVTEPDVQQETEQSQDVLQTPETNVPIDPNYYNTEMTVEIIDGYGFVGYLTIPSLQLQFPILAEMDYGRLNMSPCRFYGSTKTDNLVIGAHNYSSLFGKISGMHVGDEVLFTDMDGKLWHYRVASFETLSPTDAEILTNGEFPLSLFTCTYGGGSRITLRCELITE